MHDCQRFREDWIARFTGDPAGCDDCRLFCEETSAVLAALASRGPVEPSEEYWTGFSNRLRARLVAENSPVHQRGSWVRWMPVLASAACLVLAIAWVSLRSPAREPAEVRISFDDNHFEGLDRRVVAFLRQSELDLRNFTKIDPSFTEEIEDARNRASRSLEKMAEQKKATGDFAPVQITLNEYESILREIKNLDSAEDIADIQMRIRRNGLIANLKAYQPRVILASQR
ncbi:MAG TPA: hypothetical protein VMT78_05075 [Terriglobia bacterium]|nr:hypothetical protein [Terriglobia bacterium]